CVRETTVVAHWYFDVW
nr:immunoglobulin heavy chain junction region [Mus musculus]MBK4195223.1 immunoglobulin heavy chain junction region [Mus musculus]